MGHPRFSGSGAQAPWAIAAGQLCTPTGERNGPCGTQLQIHCLASVGEYLWMERTTISFYTTSFIIANQILAHFLILTPDLKVK